MNVQEAAAKNAKVALVRKNKLYNELYITPLKPNHVAGRSALPQGGYTRKIVITGKPCRQRSQVVRSNWATFN